MKLDLVFEETLAHPVEAVWEALTNREAISDWLMNAPGFEPVVGTRFRLKTEHLAQGGWVKAEVIELDPPRRMVWAWSVDDSPPTTVTFELTPEAGGTQLRLTHEGEIHAGAGRLIRAGWPEKIDALRRNLERA